MRIVRKPLLHRPSAAELISMAPRSKSRSAPSRPRQPEPAAQEQRLQKVLAAAGISSRRDCEELIQEGRVEVDRQVVTELGCRVDPAQHEIRVDGVVLSQPKRVHYALNKPVGVVSTNRDPAGRPRVVDLVPQEPRVFPVGRLDRGSDGLILLTNDGELANRLTHPRYGVEKTYAVRVAGQMMAETISQLRKGVYLAEGMTRVNSVKVKRRHKQSTDLEIVLDEGRNREIRRILARVGHKVLKLTRLAVGPLRLGDLPPGAYRRLTVQEVRDLEKSATQSHQADEGSPRGSRSRGSRQPWDRSKSRTAKPSAGRPPAGKPRAGKPPSGKPPSRPRKLDVVPKAGSILSYDEGDEQTPDAATAARSASGRKTPAKRPRGTSTTRGKARSGAGGEARSTEASKRAKRPADKRPGAKTTPAKRRKKGT